MKDVLFRQLLRHVVLRLFFLYFIPLFLLALFFHVQYRIILNETRDRHMKALVEQQSAMLDLFLEERLINLLGVSEDLKAEFADGPIDLAVPLEKLRHRNEAFVDIAVLDLEGKVLAYAGPHEWLAMNNYSQEAWFAALREPGIRHVITDIYTGFRGLPHFTMAIPTEVGPRSWVIKAVLSPEIIRDHIGSFEGSGEVQVVIVNASGQVQISTSVSGEYTDTSGPVPPIHPRVGVGERDVRGDGRRYAWSWMKTTTWALVGIETAKASPATGFASGVVQRIWILSGFFVLLGVVASLIQARWVAREQWKFHCRERDLNEQLIQSSKLATVGELAAGIAHEINNPLAIILEKAGLVKDTLDPELGVGMSKERIGEHLLAIERAVTRCANITSKLLGFVRQNEEASASCDPRQVVSEVVDTLLGPELVDADIEVVRMFEKGLPEVVADKGQLGQVMLNLIKNAADATEGPGTITIRALRDGMWVIISVSDTGCGLTPEEMQKVFMPFYTTKDPGQGTGLGLSVSYRIIEGMGGEMTVDGAPGQGACFTVRIPVAGALAVNGGER